MSETNLPPKADTTQEDPLLMNIMQTIREHYQPPTSQCDATTTMSTNEIYDAVRALYPNESVVTKEYIAKWMNEQGYTFIDTGKMRFEWLIKVV